MRHVHLGHGPGRYERVGPQRDYLVCEQCQTIASLPREQLDTARRAIANVTGFEVRFDHFPLRASARGAAAAAERTAPRAKP